MMRKIVGAVLAALGCVMAILLLTGGGPLLPHIIGPIILITAGMLQIFVTGSTRQAPEL